MEQRSVLKDINGQLNMNPLLAQVLSGGKKSSQDSFRRRTIQQTPRKHDEDDSDSTSSDDYRSAEEDDDFNSELDSMIKGISSVHILTPNGKKIKSQLQKSYNMNGTLDLELTQRLAKECEIANQSCPDKENISENISVIPGSQCDNENDKFSSILYKTFESVCDTTAVTTVTELDKTSHNEAISDPKLLPDASVPEVVPLVKDNETENLPKAEQAKCTILSEKINNIPNSLKTICASVVEELENNFGPTPSDSRDILNTSNEIKLQEVNNEQNVLEAISVSNSEELSNSTENNDMSLILENRNLDLRASMLNSNDDVCGTSNVISFETNNEANSSKNISLPNDEELVKSTENNDRSLILENKNLEKNPSILNSKDDICSSNEINFKAINNEPNLSETVILLNTEEFANTTENDDRRFMLENKNPGNSPSSNSKDDIVGTSNENFCYEIINEPNPSELNCVPNVEESAKSCENNDRCLILENKTLDCSQSSINANYDVAGNSNIQAVSDETTNILTTGGIETVMEQKETAESQKLHFVKDLYRHVSIRHEENQLPDFLSSFPGDNQTQLIKTITDVPSLETNLSVLTEITQSTERTPCENTKQSDLNNESFVIDLHSQLPSIISESMDEKCGSNLNQTIEIVEKPSNEYSANLQAPVYHTDTSSIAAEDRKNDCYNLNQTQENIEMQENLSAESTSPDNLNRTAIICEAKVNNVDVENIINQTSAETTFLHDVLESVSENFVQNLSTTVNINTRDMELDNIEKNDLEKTPQNLEKNTISKFNETIVLSDVFQAVSNNITQNLNITQNITNLNTTRDIASENNIECVLEKKANLNLTVTNDNAPEISNITTDNVGNFGEQFEPSFLKPDETFKFDPIDKKIANSTFLEEVHKTQETFDKAESQLQISDELLNTEPTDLCSDTIGMDHTVVLNSQSTDDCPMPNDIMKDGNEILNDTYAFNEDHDKDVPTNIKFNLNETVLKVIKNENKNDTFDLSEKSVQKHIANDDLELTKLINISNISNSNSEAQNNNKQSVIPIINFETNSVLSADVAILPKMFESNLSTINQNFKSGIDPNPGLAVEENAKYNLSKNTLELFEDLNTTNSNVEPSANLFSLLDSSNIENAGAQNTEEIKNASFTIDNKINKSIKERNPSDNCLLQLDETNSHVPNITKQKEVISPKTELDITLKCPNKNLLDSTVVISNTQNHVEVPSNRPVSPKSTSSIFKWIGQFLSPGKPGDETTDHSKESSDNDAKKDTVTRQDQTITVASRLDNDFVSLGDETPVFMSVSTTMSETFNESRANNEEQMEYLKELSELRQLVTANDDKLKNLRLQVGSYQTTASELEEKVLAHEKKLARKLEHEQLMTVTMTNFEKRIKELSVENEAARCENVLKLDDYKKDRDSAQNHLSSVESAFSRLHKKYEQCKGAIDVLKTNQDSLKDANTKLRDTAMEQKVVASMLEEHALTKIQQAHSDIESIERQHEIEMVKWTALIKKAELKKTSLEEALAKQKVENVELGVMCDQLLLKLG